MNIIKSIKIKFKDLKENILTGENSAEESISCLCNENQSKELKELSFRPSSHNILNLINASEVSENIYQTEFIIFEPDYLMDISSLAECFKVYGNHPLNYLLSRICPIDNTKYILLGNTANFFIDELVNEKADYPANYSDILKKLFKSSPFEFTACKDIQKAEEEIAFFSSCQKQFNNIRQTIQHQFINEKIDKEKAVLEPSFICNTLGLQGRLDLMLQDFSAFVELKSGKGNEDFRTGNYLHSAVNHYTQMILYLAVLEFNLDQQPDQVNSYLLYSKYPVLSKESHSRDQLQKAISLRNSIVALEYNIQQKNNEEYTHSILNKINVDNLNTSKLSGKFFENYLRPGIDKFEKMICSLNELEKAYFMRTYTFITKELWLSKLGEREYEGVKRAANLWNAPFYEKTAAGELLYDLKITNNQASSDKHYIMLDIPAYESGYLPNFRQGDAVILYTRNCNEDNVNNKQVFKGVIEHMDSSSLKIRLRARQSNISVLDENSHFAIEHDYMDSTYTGMFRGLYAFAGTNPERRELLLGKRMPGFTSQDEISSHTSDCTVDEIVNKAMTAEDCFLLIGPPGTGKTSLALKKMVEISISKNENILLLSYTNRAVDEICRALLSIDDHLNFIRVGSELSCNPEYSNRLLDSRLDHCAKRSDVKKVINECHIFVGTVASIWNKPDLLKLKQFDTAIIDEASQLLEPHLLGILCANSPYGGNAVKRFIMIGDHKQLPAVVLQSEEESRVEDSVLQEAGISNMSCSLFERLYKSYKEKELYSAFDILTSQGRMHPEISSFPSLYFYEGKLKSAGLPHQKEIIGLQENSESPIMNLIANNRVSFIKHNNSQNQNIDKINHIEARITAEIAKNTYSYYKKKSLDFHSDTLGIITPYRNQMALIRKYLHSTGIKELSEIIIDTVERFQGSQKDMIIYSFCVNTNWQLKALPNIMEENGFIIDRKLNVVLTRARKQLFIIGNPNFLSQNQLYKNLIDHIEKNGTTLNAEQIL